MFQLLRTAFTLLITVGIGACGNGGLTQPSDARLTTDSASYTAVPIGYSQVVVRVVTRYRNPTSTPIALDRCYPNSPYPIFGVELVAPKNQEGAGYNPDWACVGNDKPILVGPGESRVDTLTRIGVTPGVWTG
jgi:hypothetical protein